MKKEKKTVIIVEPRKLENNNTVIVVQVKNNSDERQKFVLFGKNRHSLMKNFGNKKCIEIKSLNSDSYSIDLNTNFYFIKMRIQSVKNINLHKKIKFITDFPLENKKITQYYNLALMMNAYQQQSDIIDCKINNDEINMDTHIAGEIEPNSYLTFSFFVKEN